MKKLALTLLVVLGVAGMAQGETLWSCGFETGEGYTTGLLTGQGGWTDGWEAGSGLFVSDLNKHGGTQSARWDFNANWQGWDIYVREFGLKTEGTVTVEFWFRLEDSGGTDIGDTQGLVTRIGNQQGTDGTYSKEYYMIPAHNSADVATYSPNHYRHYDETSNNTTTNRYMAGITDENEWKGIRIVTDLDNDLIDMYGRSESDGSWTTMAIGLDRVFPEDGIGSVAFYSLSAYNTTLGYQGTNDVYLDDILVTWVPEPATICLLTVGGLGVLMKRRRR